MRSTSIGTRGTAGKTQKRGGYPGACSALQKNSSGTQRDSLSRSVPLQQSARAGLTVLNRLTSIFRRAVLEFLVNNDALSEGLRSRMLGWRHSGL
jgi:hypothetical protein